MIYKIFQDDTYRTYSIDAGESFEKLGDEYGTFSFNNNMIAYSEVWTPLNIEFIADGGNSCVDIADLSASFGRLLLTPKAYEVLFDILNPFGEFLPVIYLKNQHGYIFNPLVDADNLNALNKELLSYDQYNNLTNIVFNEAELGCNVFFKSGTTDYLDMYCTEDFKKAYENAGLTGITFSVDLAALLNEPAYSQH